MWLIFVKVGCSRHVSNLLCLTCNLRHVFFNKLKDVELRNWKCMDSTPFKKYKFVITKIYGKISAKIFTTLRIFFPELLF